MSKIMNRLFSQTNLNVRNFDDTATKTGQNVSNNKDPNKIRANN